MNKISEEQEDLLERFETQKPPPELVIRYLFNFLTEKPEDEPLDPRWRDI